ncbi:MAG: hypothetical protein MJ152_02720 [Clostridia bacterium]|nr:hypothetical protein [Clostridia bacterium]
MKHTYIIEEKRCPHCKCVLERNGGGLEAFGIILLTVALVGIPICWFLAKFLLNALFNYEKVKMGNPCIECPSCHNLVRTNEFKEWGFLNAKQKRDWAFSNWMILVYICGILLIFGILFPLLIGLWSSTHNSDHVIAIVCSIAAGISFIIICAVLYLRKKRLAEEYITVNEEDYSMIKKSYSRLKSEDPNFIETDTIKISTTGQIIKPEGKFDFFDFWESE